MRRLAWVVGVVAVVLVGGCGLDKPKPAPSPDDSDGSRVSAADLGDHGDDDRYQGILSPEERAALQRVDGDERSEVDDNPDAPPSHSPELDPPKGFFGRLSDALGKIGVGILGVAMTLGIAAAPFLIF